jgi:hypothetical protein
MAIRVKHDRCLADGEGTRLWDATTAGAPLGAISFTIGGREKQKAREVRQQLWARPVLIGAGKKDRSRRPASWRARSMLQPV